MCHDSAHESRHWSPASEESTFGNQCHQPDSKSLNTTELTLVGLGGERLLDNYREILHLTFTDTKNQRTQERWRPNQQDTHQSCSEPRSSVHEFRKSAQWVLAFTITLDPAVTCSSEARAPSLPHVCTPRWWAVPGEAEALALRPTLHLSLGSFHLHTALPTALLGDKGVRCPSLSLMSGLALSKWTVFPAKPGFSFSSRQPFCSELLHICKDLAQCFS